MAAIATHPFLLKLHDNRGMVFPIAFISLVLVILVPLPTQVLDILLMLQHHAVGHRAGDDHLCAQPAGILGVSFVAAGDDAVPAGAERRHGAADL